MQRFWDKVDKHESGCWLWTASKNARGYGQIRIDGRTLHAHRVAYELIVGSIPKDKVIDHLCRNTSCVNPSHLEVVTQKENVRRGNQNDWQRAVTHCPQGHEYTLDNTYRYHGRRQCRTCKRLRCRTYWRTVRKYRLQNVK